MLSLLAPLGSGTKSGQVATQSRHRKAEMDHGRKRDARSDGPWQKAAPFTSYIGRCGGAPAALSTYLGRYSFTLAPAGVLAEVRAKTVPSKDCKTQVSAVLSLTSSLSSGSPMAQHYAAQRLPVTVMAMR
jgi:hypothetical protein